MGKEIFIRKKSMKDYLVSLHEMTIKQAELIESLIREYDDSENESQEQPSDQSRHLIKGVRGLAKHLGCCVATAQDIINSGILLNREIAYKAGTRWIFNANRLDELLRKEPDVLNRKIR